MQICQMVWTRGVAILLLGSGICALVATVWGAGWAIATAAAYLLVFVLLMYFTLCSTSAASYIERRILLSGNLLSAALLAKAAGPSISAGAGESQPWYTRLQFGDTDGRLVLAAVCVFGIAMAAVVVLQVVKARQGH